MEAVFTRNSKVVKKNIPKFKFGIPSFDKILTGGLLQGTMTLIEEDAISKHFYSFIRCFLAEGAQNKEQLFYYSTLPTENLIPPVGKMPKQADSKMRIAWRYTQTSSSTSESCVFDLSKSISYPVKQSSFCAENLYSIIYSDLEKSMVNSTDDLPRRLVVRLALQEWTNKGLNTFLISLKTLLRSLNAVCLLTVNTNFSDGGKGFICEKHSDLVMVLKDFTEDNPFIGFCGMLEVKKNVALQSLACYDLPSRVFGVIRDQKFLSVENLSLPPADSSSNSKVLDY
jgi:hypothetical protein